MTINEAIKRLEQMKADLHRKKKLKWPTRELEVQYFQALFDDMQALEIGIGALRNIVHLGPGTNEAEKDSK
jgi:hypothetical protein